MLWVVCVFDTQTFILSKNERDKVFNSFADRLYTVRK